MSVLTASRHLRDARERTNLRWLVWLRWGAGVGHVCAILIGELALGMDLPLAALLSIIGVALVSNLGFHVARERLARVPVWLTGTIMVADVLMLTGLLYLSGGPANPGIVFYFVHIGLATMMLGFAWRLGVVLVTLLSLLALFFLPPPPWGGATLSGLPATGGIYELGLLLSMTIAAGFIFYFGDRMTTALARRELALARARERAMQDEKLASLANLAAGAAHELATPLTTIAMLAKELERGLLRGDLSSDEMAEDAAVIRAEVWRCRDVLNLMAAEAGESRGEAFEDVAVSRLLEEALRDLPRDRITVEVEEASVHVPVRPMALAVRGIVKNALQASPGGADVLVRSLSEEGGCRIEVSDRGPGMSEDVARRAIEPFFTTKPTGQGMGLGLYLANDLARRAGGLLDIDTEPGRGTRVSLRLPRPRRAA
ncbi:MAG: HAMP domain-containing histidine kinase [Myxococcales bacterium]|nr:HAMP domain-containing histidine kinase [Myxococcales bacterium]